MGFVFPYGIAFSSGEFFQDPQTFNLAMLIQVLLVFPFLMFATIHMQDRLDNSIVKEQPFSVKLLKKNLLLFDNSDRRLTKNLARLILPFYFVMVLFFVL